MERPRRFRVAVNAEEWRPTPAEFERALAFEVQPEEQAKTKKYFFEPDRKTSIIGRLLLRSLTHTMLGLYNSEIRFDRTDKDCERFNINISHSGRWVVCAGDCDMPVGIDVNDYGMRRNSIMDFKLCDQDPTLEAQYRQMAADFLESFVGPYGSIFAPAELVHMRALMADPSCTAEQQLLTFSRYWTCKESYVKVFGDGLGFDVSRLCFDFSDTPSADLPFLNPETSSSSVCSHFLPLRGLRFTVDGHSPPPGWRFEQIRLDRNHLCTVATAPPPPSVAERHDPPSELHVWNVPKMLSILLDAEDPIGF